ncbi:MAG: methionyl-tRNA formyltransferase [Woeseiaceae bacterium]
MTAPRVIFAGTPAFARESLQALVESGTKPVAVFTQPDRPAGRGKKLTASPVKEYALQQSIEVLQPETLRDDNSIQQITALDADVMIVAAYGLLLPQRVLDLPKHGCINVHASLLPRWRGAAPIQAAILAGDEQTGVCLMSMTAGLDCGPVFVSQASPIMVDENAGGLHDRLAVAGAELLVENLPGILDGALQAVAQDDDQATYAHKIKTTDASIDWQRPATELARLVRAYNPVPGAWFMLDKDRIKCWQAETSSTDAAPPGQVIASDADGVVVACGQGALRLLELQRAGKKRVNAAQFSANAELVGRQL